MIALLGHFDLDFSQSEFIEKMTGQLATGAGITIRRIAVLAQYLLYPDPRNENDQQQQQNAENYEHYRYRLSRR